MVGKTGSSVPVILMYLFDTPHDREDWVACPSGSDTSPGCSSPLMVGKTGSSVPVILTCYLTPPPSPHGRED